MEPPPLTPPSCSGINLAKIADLLTGWVKNKDGDITKKEASDKARASNDSTNDPRPHPCYLRMLLL